MFKRCLLLLSALFLMACDESSQVKSSDVQVNVPMEISEDLSAQQIQLAKLLKKLDQRLKQWQAITTEFQIEQTQLAINYGAALIELSQTQVMDLEKNELLSSIDHVEIKLKTGEKSIELLSDWHHSKREALLVRKQYFESLKTEMISADPRQDETWSQTLAMETQEHFIDATQGWLALHDIYQANVKNMNASLNAKSLSINSRRLWLVIANDVAGLKPLKTRVSKYFNLAKQSMTEYQYTSATNYFAKASQTWQQLTHQGRVQISMPNMLLVKGGAFEMGDHTGNGDSDELPLHNVTLANYKMSQTEITFVQYDNFAQAVGKPLPSDEGWGRGKRPVINISWQDAHEFAIWLSEKSGKSLRLPSEAEWEYAAKSGQKDIWDTQNAGNKANCEGCYKWDNNESVPVAQFPANAFGLYDLQGNVWEWTRDCYTDTYQQKNNTPAACDTKAVRGGSWYDLPTQLRSSNRSKAAIKKQSNRIGFRLVEDLSTNRIAADVAP